MAASFRSARALRALLAASCLFPVVQACGGRSDTEDFLFDTDGAISVAGASANAGRGAGSSGGTRAGGVGGTIATGATGNTAGAQTGGASAIGGSGIIEAGQPGVAGTLAAGGNIGTGGSSGVAGNGVGGTGVAGAGIAGAGGAAPDQTTITCGSDSCNPLTQVCCFSGGFQCIGEDDACPGAVLNCTTSSDCAGSGQMCCLSITGDAADAASCKMRCDNAGSGRDRQLCEVDGDCQAPFRYCRPTVFGLNICTRRPN